MVTGLVAITTVSKGFAHTDKYEIKISKADVTPKLCYPSEYKHGRVSPVVLEVPEKLYRTVSLLIGGCSSIALGRHEEKLCFPQLQQTGSRTSGLWVGSGPVGGSTPHPTHPHSLPPAGRT